jgi:hypothetical protein
MVLASSATAAAPAKEFPKPLALCSVSANPDACACEAIPVNAPATASESAVLVIPAHLMKFSSLVWSN